MAIYSVTLLSRCALKLFIFFIWINWFDRQRRVNQQFGVFFLLLLVVVVIIIFGRFFFFFIFCSCSLRCFFSTRNRECRATERGRETNSDMKAFNYSVRGKVMWMPPPFVQCCVRFPVGSLYFPFEMVHEVADTSRLGRNFLSVCRFCLF